MIMLLNNELRSLKLHLKLLYLSELAEKLALEQLLFLCICKKFLREFLFVYSQFLVLLSLILNLLYELHEHCDRFDQFLFARQLCLVNVYPLDQCHLLLPTTTNIFEQHATIRTISAEIKFNRSYVYIRAITSHQSQHEM